MEFGHFFLFVMFVVLTVDQFVDFFLNSSFILFRTSGACILPTRHIA